MNNNKTIILIGGKKRAGKDTLADALCNEFTLSDVSNTKLQLSTPIKEWTYKNIGAEGIEYSKEQLRPYMQAMGAGIRLADDFYLCGEIMKQVDSNNKDVTIISDWRLESEYNHFRIWCDLNDYTLCPVYLERPALASTETDITEQLKCSSNYTRFISTTVDDLVTNIAPRLAHTVMLRISHNKANNYIGYYAA